MSSAASCPRPEWKQRRTFDYEVGTLAIQNRQQISLVPADDSASDDVEALLQMPEPGPDGVDPLAGLAAQARAVREQAQLQPEQHLEIAKALTRLLRESGLFQYSDSGQKRPDGVDPLEDFVTANRRGHCEYFAGALALMLRSQGIPARVALGFRASEFNSAGSYYQVRQLHAHAWVEALLEPDDLAGEKLPQGAASTEPGGLADARSDRLQRSDNWTTGPIAAFGAGPACMSTTCRSCGAASFRVSTLRPSTKSIYAPWPRFFGACLGIDQKPAGPRRPATTFALAGEA